MKKNYKQSKISIITVSYNAIKTIEQTILSVINQSYLNLEYIIIDGKSIDGTIDIIKKYENKLSFWVSEPDNGIYDAMNKGIDVSTGDYIYFLGADDCLVNKDIINLIVNYIHDDFDFDVLSGLVWSVYPESKMQQVFSNNIKNTKLDDLKQGNIMAPHQGMFVKSSVMKNLKFDSKYKIAADYKFILTLWNDPKYKIKKIEDIVAFYSAEGISNTNIPQRNQEYIEVLKELNLGNRGFERQFEVEKNNIKEIIKIILRKINLLEFMQSLKGWKRHSCDWEKCRWCR